MFDDALIKEVRDRNNIVTVVGDYVTLRKAGTSYKGLCPFHNEKTPSFHVHEDRQFFYCFGCQVGGDVIKFVQEINGFSFVEAIRQLADRAAIRLPDPTERSSSGPGRRRGPSSASRSGGRSSRALRGACFDIGDDAQRFYGEALHQMQGQACRAYLSSRGLGKEAIERFGLGFAPDSWEALASHLRTRGVDLKLAETMGLIAPRKSGGGHYDRFRNRLMFPIRSAAGRTIAFSGRDLSGEDETPKYINSPETPVYTKGDTLFGMYEARKALRTEGWAILVEGNVDLVRLSVAGLENIVAPLGTALTEAQARLLRRRVERVTLLYDGDRAGREAALKAIPVALSQGLQVSVALLPDGDDPDTFFGREGLDPLRQLLSDAVAGWDHLVDAVITETDALSDPAGPVRAVDKLAPALSAIEDPRARQLYQRSLAGTLRLDERTLSRFVRQARQRGARRDTGGPAVQPERPRWIEPPAREMKLLSLLLQAPPEAGLLFMGRDLAGLMTHEAVREAAAAWARQCEDEEQPADATGFVTGLDDGPLRANLFSALSADADPTNWRTDFEQLERGLKLDALARRKSHIQAELDQARRRGDESRVLEMQQLKLQVTREIEDLKRR